MKALVITFVASAIILGLVWLIYEVSFTPHQKYEFGKSYGSMPVSFGYACKLSNFTPEMRIIYNRKRYFTTKACVYRSEAVRDVVPAAVLMGRSRYDASYKVTMLFDKAQSARISRMFDGSGREIVLYRGDTLLTYLLIQGDGFGGEISTYQDSREDADSAMDQVALGSDLQPTQSWHR